MLEIRKPDILRRLTTRLGVKPPAGGPIGWLSNIVILTNPVDDLLKTALIKLVLVSVTGAGQFTAFTVPVGKRWRLFHYTLDRVGGTYLFSQIIINDGTNIMAIDIFTSTTGPLSRNFNGQSYLLNENWQIVFNTDTYSVTGDAGMRVFVEEEDAF